MNPVPFQERKTRLRAVWDVATGCYPGFVFGGPLRNLLPVFHFHDVTTGGLEPYLRYLAENDYSGVDSAAIADLVLRGRHPGPRTVALCFDDAWASLWTVALPLLRRYKFKAIAYVIPGLVKDAPTPRPSAPPAGADGRNGPALATWPELRALQSSGIVDLQAHTYSHAMMFCHDRPLGYVTPDYHPPPLAAPLTGEIDAPAFLAPAELGAPLYPQRARCSDARRYRPDPEADQACREYVKAHGGREYFREPNWRKPLDEIMARANGTWETAAEMQQAIRHDLELARATIDARLGRPEVRQMCFPWAIAGMTAEKTAQELGYITAFADRLGGKRAVRAGDNPFRLMRLKHQFIPTLPGRRRRTLLQIIHRR